MRAQHIRLSDVYLTYLILLLSGKMTIFAHGYIYVCSKQR